jgi:diguanylate cyclase (GGDEF)-like protein/PAS domain S-box-containing protein
VTAHLQIGIERSRSKVATAFDSLKLRITLGAVGAVMLGIGLTTTTLVRQAEHDTLVAQSRREMAETAHAAARLSQRVVELQRALQATAAQLDAATLADDARLAAFMEAQPVLRGMFTSLYATGIDGHMRIYVDAQGLRRPDLDLSARPYYRRTLTEQRALVSEALPGQVTGEPVILFTYPLMAAGRMYGVLGGALRLAGRGLLVDVADEEEGADTSELIVVTDGEGLLIAHPNPSRLLQPLSTEPRLAQAFARWLADGSAAEPTGLPLEQKDELASAAGVAGMDWMVWHATPQAELFAPLLAARRQALTQAGAFIALTSVAVLLLLGWLLRPLTRLEHRAQHLFDGTRDPQLGWPDSRGEIGRLSRVLRHVGAERAQLEAFNTQVLQKLGLVMSAAPVGIAFTRAQRFELVSDEFCQLLGYAEDALLGQRAEMVLSSSADSLAVESLVALAFEAKQPYVGEWQMRRADGSCFPARLRARPVEPGNAAAGAIWTIVDIVDQVAERTQLEWSASHDALTGLANRKALGGRLTSVFEALPRSMPAAIVMIDLDHFKPINDQAGHAAGDAMLRAVAVAITGCVRVGDLAVRLGGDEFAVLLERCALDVALRIAENVRVAITDITLPWEEHTLRVGASLGVASLAQDTPDAATWMKAADAACYCAKAEGRGAVRAASGRQTEVLGQDSSVDADLQPLQQPTRP